MGRRREAEPLGQKGGVVTFHEGVMSSVQQDVLRRIGAVGQDMGFYLGGGTAVAIHLGHRRSMDLGWFVDEAIPDPMVLAQDLRGRGVEVATIEVARGTLHADLDGVRVSFLEYRYPLLEEVVAWREYGCSLAALEDLACMKLSALAGRGARKDFVDVYALGTARFDPSEMLDLYRAKYSPADLGHVLMSLAYFDDAEREELPEMLWDVGWDEMRRTIEEWVRELAG